MRDAVAHTPGLKDVTDFFSKVPDWAVLLFFLAFILLQAVPSLIQDSLTFDELLRQLPGYLHLTAGEYRFHTEHPPLVKMLAALPLLFIDVKIPSPPEHWTDSTRWLFHQDFLYRANDADQFVLLGRLAVLPLTLFLGLFVFRWAKALFGRGGASFALLLYCFEPNILAHGRLMNTDLPVAAFLFVSIYYFSRMIHAVTWTRLVFAGVSLGLALVTKYSAVLTVPSLLLLGIAIALSPRPIVLELGSLAPTSVTRRGRKLLLLLGTLVVIGLIAYVVIWSVYRFQYVGGTAAGYAYPQPWEEILPDRPTARAAILWAREVKLLPEAYLYGLSVVLHKVKRTAFLMGEISSDGWWYYYLVTFFLKTPLPFLLFLALAVAGAQKGWRGKRLEALPLLLPPLVYFAAASASRSDIGHRYVLSIYPFLFVCVGALIPWAIQQRTLVKGTMAVLAAWYLVSSVAIFPHYLAYFNELAGGPEGGYKYLVDSNLDWGQDLKGLKRYMDAHGIPRVWLSYFGTASASYYGIAYNQLPSYPSISKPDKAPTPFVAISATNLQGVYFEDSDVFKKFRDRTPIAKIGYSIFIYRLD